MKMLTYKTQQVTLDELDRSDQKTWKGCGERAATISHNWSSEQQWKREKTEEKEAKMELEKTWKRERERGGDFGWWESSLPTSDSSCAPVGLSVLNGQQRTSQQSFPLSFVVCLFVDCRLKIHHKVPTLFFHLKNDGRRFEIGSGLGSYSYQQFEEQQSSTTGRSGSGWRYGRFNQNARIRRPRENSRF